MNFDEVLSREKRKLQLLELEEMSLNTYESSKSYKQKVKAYHDKKLLKKNFQPGSKSCFSIQDSSYFWES